MNLPANINVSSWQVQQTGTVVQYTPNGNSISITRVNDGSFTLIANLSGNACGSSSIAKTFSAGAPPITLTATNTGTCSNGYQTWYLSANPSTNGTNWNWTVDYLGTNADIYIAQPSASATNVDVKGGGTLKLTYTDRCGVNKTDGVTVYSNCPPGFAVTPNPAQNNITVSSDDNATNLKKTPSLLYAIKITDRLGTLRKTLHYKAGITSTKISVADLNAGMYLVSVFDGRQWSSQSLLIQR